MKRMLCIAILSLMSMVGIASAQSMTAIERDEFQKWQEFKRMKQDTPTAQESINHFAGLGKEIGTALKDAVQALDQTITVTEDHVYKFASTPTGKVTLGILAWKIAGKDLLGVAVGAIFLLSLIPWLYFWLRYFFIGKMLLDKKTIKPNTTGIIWWNTERTYTRVKASDEMSSEVYVFWCFVFVIGSLTLFIGSMVCFFK